MISVVVNFRKTLTSLILILLLAHAVVFALLDPAEIPHRRLKGLFAQTIEDVVALPEDQIDLATAALIISKTWNPQINVETGRANLDLIAVHLAKRLQNMNSPQAMLEELNHYIFGTLAYKGVASVNDPNDFFLNSVLQRRQGYCLGLSVFLLSLAERVDLPLHGVAVPGHFFVRYDNGHDAQNIEAAQNGLSFDDEYYRRQYGVRNADSFYLRNLSKKEVIGVLLSNFGNHLLADGRTDEALRALTLSVRVVPGLAEAHTNLGVACLRFHKPQEAASQERLALAITPSDARSNANLAAALCELGNLDEALTQARLALTLDPQLPDALVTLGTIYGSKNLLDASIEQYQKAIQLDPRYAIAYANLGVTYLKKGMLQEGIDNLNKALEIDPQLADAHLALAAAYEQTGKSALAREHLDRARALDPNIVPRSPSSP